MDNIRSIHTFDIGQLIEIRYLPEFLGEEDIGSSQWTRLCYREVHDKIDKNKKVDEH